MNGSCRRPGSASVYAGKGNGDSAVTILLSFPGTTCLLKYLLLSYGNAVDTYEKQKVGNRMKIRKWMALAMTLCMLGTGEATAFAAGPGDALEAGSDAAAGTSAAEENYWSGYKNADGTDFTYLEKGTEVSKFQNLNGDIDWNAARAAGLDFVMVRIAYGLTEDAYFDVNVQGAQAAGIKVGAYLCSTAKNMEQVIAEANLTVEKIQKYQLQYPVAFDIEVNSILSEGATPAELTAMSNKYCEIVRNAGYTPIVYANKTWLTKYMNVADIPYDVWFASYAEDKVYRPVSGTNTTIWQSSEKGTINGIKGKITTEFSKKAYGGGNSTLISAGSSSTGSTGTVVVGTGPVASSNTADNSAVVGEAPGSAGSGTGSSASVSDGWSQQANGSWYYYEGGKPVTGWKKLNDRWYYLQADGSMATGWLQTDNSWYYLYPAGDMATGWCNVGESWYWLGADGAMRTGWKKIGESWYYLDESGVMLKDLTRNINGVDYRFDANGIWVE